MVRGERRRAEEGRKRKGGGDHYFSTHGTGLVGSFDFAVEGTALLFATTAAARRAATSKKEAMAGTGTGISIYKDTDIHDNICQCGWMRVC